ncbi:hypothetical protein [Streptosporangium lutulentum]|uniref:Uncharacterized protein n=1 Tax=Streptosporangium lutulentum TaxID=1461250 RepID=A0ABT9QJ68_9ACTN|nr:hypothetical protein [Streptosporangium lutulentum]MDP9846757.1 hypothetical protein [Streptosporangium lutulentum]
MAVIRPSTGTRRAAALCGLGAALTVPAGSVAGENHRRSSCGSLGGRGRAVVAVRTACV